MRLANFTDHVVSVHTKSTTRALALFAIAAPPDGSPAAVALAALFAAFGAEDRVGLCVDASAAGGHSSSSGAYAYIVPPLRDFAGGGGGLAAAAQSPPTGPVAFLASCYGAYSGNRIPPLTSALAHAAPAAPAALEAAAALPSHGPRVLGYVLLEYKPDLWLHTEPGDWLAAATRAAAPPPPPAPLAPLAPPVQHVPMPPPPPALSLTSEQLLSDTAREVLGQLRSVVMLQAQLRGNAELSFLDPSDPSYPRVRLGGACIGAAPPAPCATFVAASPHP